MLRSTAILLLTTQALTVTAQVTDGPDLSRYRVGSLGDDAIGEASGLVCPGPSVANFWTHNDAGNEARLYELDSEGEVVSTPAVSGAVNRDWEDISLLRTGDSARLVVADIGDNDGVRPMVQLYVLNSPVDLTGERAAVVETYDVRYPDGPRDSESMAIDSQSRTAWLLSKRTVPAELYSLPLEDAPDGVATLAFRGTLHTLPQPSERDIALAPERLDWFWQPTAMDFSPDGKLAAVLTYQGIYLYARQHDEDWAGAFARAPKRFSLGQGWVAEALCLTEEAVYWTTEGEASGFFRIPLADPGWSLP